MATFDIKRIRNIALLGHSGSGKTSLAEALLYVSGGSDRLGKTAEGNSNFDYDPEAIRRKISVAAGFAPVYWKDIKINLIDTPGQPGLAGEVAQALRVADSAVILVDGKAGVQVGTELAWERATAAGLPKAFFINKFDDNEARFGKTLDALHEQFGRSICPITIPMVKDGSVRGAIDLVDLEAHVFDDQGRHSVQPVPDESKEAVEKYRDMLLEAVAGTDEALMEKFFGGEDITHMEIVNAVHEGIIHGDIVPCFCGCATKLWGAWTLLNTISESFPRHSAKGKEISADGDEIEIQPEGAPAIFVFRTVADPFVGKMSFFKVMNGAVKGDTTLKNFRDGSTERLGKIYVIKGKQQTEVEQLCCGDIGMAAKLVSAQTGDTLSWNGDKQYAQTEYPLPFYIRAIQPTAKGDEDKISSGVARLLDEDPTLRYEVDKETKQMIITGMGGTHLELAQAKLKARYGVDVQLTERRIAYREAIRKSVKIQGKHKKQSGGHGQYGDVWIEFSPGEDGLEFTESVVGGAVPKNFFPAVEKGLQECMVKGVLAGYPMVGLKANLYDGSYHDVDSSEMAFKTAASIAYRDGIPKCSPVLLEPIGNLRVLVPDGQVGDVIGDLNKRRGKIMGMDQANGKRGYSVVEAEVPESEMADYVHVLRAISQGRGSFTFYFSRYADVPSNIVEKIIADAKTEE